MSDLRLSASWSPFNPMEPQLCQPGSIHTGLPRRSAAAAMDSRPPPMTPTVLLCPTLGRGEGPRTIHRKSMSSLGTLRFTVSASFRVGARMSMTIPPLLQTRSSTLRRLFPLMFPTRTSVR